MYAIGHMNGWGWVFGSIMMLVWALVIGFVVYAAIRLAQGDRKAQ